ncbi:MAG: hypothetical protein JJU40_08805 [Rhodobacteraceae bacterium]|nr:hypothetical protein [Paracoccaceae bacterium]
MARTSFAWLLSALLALASFGFAAAPRVVAGHEVVICRGNTIVTIVIGPDGTPLEQVRICPDMGVLQAAGLPATPQPPYPVTAARILRLLSRRRAVGGHRLACRARGPPLS